MPECAYEPCKIVFEIRPGAKGKPRQFCCKECLLLSRRKPERTIKCGYCGESFTTRRSRKLYCCRQCQQASGRGIRATSQTPEETERKALMAEAKAEARMDATLNCTLHRGCLDTGKLPCLNCKKILWVKDAWKSELKYQICNHNSGGENRMNLPARGTV